MTQDKSSKGKAGGVQIGRRLSDPSLDRPVKQVLTAKKRAPREVKNKND